MVSSDVHLGTVVLLNIFKSPKKFFSGSAISDLDWSSSTLHKFTISGRTKRFEFDV